MERFIKILQAIGITVLIFMGFSVAMGVIGGIFYVGTLLINSTWGGGVLMGVLFFILMCIGIYHGRK